MLAPMKRLLVKDHKEPTARPLADPLLRFHHSLTYPIAHKLRAQVARLLPHEMILIEALSQALRSFSPPCSKTLGWLQSSVPDRIEARALWQRRTLNRYKIRSKQLRDKLSTLDDATLDIHVLRVREIG
jgi:hypothetical protein